MTVGRSGDGRERPQGDCQPAARLNARPAPTTWAACSRPGWRVNRSRGPETDTAATTVPSAANTGADTDATPPSRSATRPPRPPAPPPPPPPPPAPAGRAARRGACEARAPPPPPPRPPPRPPHAEP